MSEACIVIPARYASSRYPGKPLVPLIGANGTPRSLLERSVIAARKAAEEAGGGIPVYVATDDERIESEANRIGAEAIMTNRACRNGTERVAEAVERLGVSYSIIINLQGDAPLTPPSFVTALLKIMRADTHINIATPILRCDGETFSNFIADRKNGRVGATTVVSNQFGQALYFSKEVLPFTNGKEMVRGIAPVFHHIGLYAYRRRALEAYQKWSLGPLEELEGLEQLRFLENGYSIRTIEVDAQGKKFWEVNNPSDVPLIERYLAEMAWD